MLMRSRSLSNAKDEALIRPKHQQQPQKSKSTHDFNCDSDNSNDFEDTEDKTDSEFTLKAKKITRRASNRTKMQEIPFLPELSPIFFKGLRIFVKLSKTAQKETSNINSEEFVKRALEQNGSIIVENSNFSDLIITDEITTRSLEFQKYNQNRQVLLDQISWIKDFNPAQSNNFQNNVSFNYNAQLNSISTTSNMNFSPKSSFKSSNRSVLSSPMANNDNTSPHFAQTPPKTRRPTSGIRISSPIRRVILPSNSTSPSATIIPSITMASTVNINPNLPCTLNSSLNSIMINKNNGINDINQTNIGHQKNIQRAGTKNSNESYRKIQCLPIASHSQKLPEIVVSDYRHLYAPITKVFNSTEQIPQLYIEPAPRYYFMTPFQPVPPNAHQIARACMLDRGNKLQNKANVTQSNFKPNTNDVAAVIGKSNYYCYICRTNFENPYDHHDSNYHIRNTTPLWDEFDSIAASFNRIESESQKGT